MENKRKSGRVAGRSVTEDKDDRDFQNTVGLGR